MVIENVISEERKKNAIDLMVMMVVDELSEDMHRKPSELLPEFVCSQTGRLLYDEESRLWWSGSSDIVEMYKAEIAKSSSQTKSS